MIFLYFGASSSGALSTKIPPGGSALTPLSEALPSEGNDTGEAPPRAGPPEIIPEPQKHDDHKPSRARNTSEVASTSWWWSTCVLGPIVVICLVPFVWCYVLPKLGLAGWEVFVGGCTLVGVSAALAVIYLVIIATFDYLGVGVGGTLKSLPQRLGEFSHHLPTPLGMAALTLTLMVLAILLWCLPLICHKLSALSKTRAGVPLVRIAPAFPPSIDITYSVVEVF